MTEAEKLVEECAKAEAAADGVVWDDLDEVYDTSFGDSRSRYKTRARAAISVTLEAAARKMDALDDRHDKVEYQIAGQEIRALLP